MKFSFEQLVSDNTVKFCFDHVKNLVATSLLLYSAALVLARASDGGNHLKSAAGWIVLAVAFLLGLMLEINFFKNLRERTGIIVTVFLCVVEVFTFAALIAQPVLSKVYS